MGARICFSWEAGSWRLYPGKRLADELRARLTLLCTENGKALPAHLAQHLALMALALREGRLGALLVVSSSEEMIKRLNRNRQSNLSPVEALHSRLFVVANYAICLPGGDSNVGSKRSLKDLRDQGWQRRLVLVQREMERGGSP